MSREKAFMVFGGGIVAILLTVRGYLWYADRPADAATPADEAALAQAIEEAKRQKMQEAADEVSERLRQQIRQQVKAASQKALLIGTWTEDDDDEILTIRKDGTYLASADPDEQRPSKDGKPIRLPDMSGHWKLEEKQIHLEVADPPGLDPLQGEIVAVTATGLTIRWSSGNTDQYTRKKP